MNKRPHTNNSKENFGKSSKINNDLIEAIDMKKVLASVGPIVDCVVLHSDGTKVQLKLDMTPHLQLVASTLGSSPTFIGSWEDIDVCLVMRADQDNPALPLNVHKLQPPFHKVVAKGDILLMKTDESGIQVDFTLAEYDEFLALEIPEWEVTEETTEKPESDGEDEDSQDEDDDDSEGDDDEASDNEEDSEHDAASDNEDGGGNDEDEQAQVFQLIQSSIFAEFENIHSHQPSQEQCAFIIKWLQVILQQFEDIEQSSEDDLEALRVAQLAVTIEKFTAEEGRSPAGEEQLLLNLMLQTALQVACAEDDDDDYAEAGMTGDDAAQEESFRVIVEQLVDDFEVKNCRDPTEDEFNEIMATAQAQLQQFLQQQAAGADDDEADQDEQQQDAAEDDEDQDSGEDEEDGGNDDQAVAADADDEDGDAGEEGDDEQGAEEDGSGEGEGGDEEQCQVEGETGSEEGSSQDN